MEARYREELDRIMKDQQTLLTEVEAKHKEQKKNLEEEKNQH